MPDRRSNETATHLLVAMRAAQAGCAKGCTLRRMIPWIIVAVVAVPLVVIGFLAMRRNAAGSELPVGTDPNASARTDQEFAEAEAYQAKWHEADKERFHQERLP